FDPLAFLDRQLGDAGADVGADLDLRLGLDLAGAIDRLDDLRAADFGGLDLGVLAPPGAGNHDAAGHEDEDKDIANPKETAFDFHADSTVKGLGWEDRPASRRSPGRLGSQPVGPGPRAPTLLPGGAAANEIP